MKTSEISNFLSLKNNSATLRFNFLLDFISAILSSKPINTVLFLLDYSLTNFHKHHQLFVNNQLIPLAFLNFYFLLFSSVNKQYYK